MLPTAPAPPPALPAARRAVLSPCSPSPTEATHAKGRKAKRRVSENHPRDKNRPGPLAWPEQPRTRRIERGRRPYGAYSPLNDTIGSSYPYSKTAATPVAQSQHVPMLVLENIRDWRTLEARWLAESASERRIGLYDPEGCGCTETQATRGTFLPAFLPARPI